MRASHREAAFTAARAVTAALLALASSATVAGARSPSNPWRSSPMSVVTSDSTGGLEISEGRIEDAAVTGSAPPSSPAARRAAYRIRRFVFRVKKVPPREAGFGATLSVKGWDGQASIHSAGLNDLHPGATFEIPAAIDVTRADEGPFTADLEIRDSAGAVLNATRFAFGYPRYTTASGMNLSARDLTVLDDFEAPSLNTKIWSLVRGNPDRSTIRQRDGRLWIESKGPIGYNGVRSVEVRSRDVDLVCRVGIEAGGADHNALLHLCGSGTNSPDHWLEIKLLDRDGNGSVVVSLSAPPALMEGARGPVELERPASDGFTLKITSDGFTHRARGWVLAAKGWTPIGDAFEIPARVSRAELKVEGWLEPGGTSRVWFDDCRMYPRPESHYVGVRLERPGGDLAGALPGSWPPVAFGPANRTFGGRDLSLRLYTGDGETLVAETTFSDPLDYAFLPLRDAPWRSYPASAVIRLYLRGVQLGPDEVIESSGVDGLYPGDVYAIRLE